MLITVLDAIADCLDRESARKLVRLDFEKQIRDQVQKLALKERRSRLSPEEQGELVLLLSVDQVLAHLQRKARAILRRPRSAEPPRKRN